MLTGLPALPTGVCGQPDQQRHPRRRAGAGTHVQRRGHGRCPGYPQREAHSPETPGGGDERHPPPGQVSGRCWPVEGPDFPSWSPHFLGPAWPLQQGGLLLQIRKLRLREAKCVDWNAVAEQTVWDKAVEPPGPWAVRGSVSGECVTWGLGRTGADLRGRGGHCRQGEPWGPRFGDREGHINSVYGPGEPTRSAHLPQSPPLKSERRINTPRR